MLKKSLFALSHHLKPIGDFFPYSSTDLFARYAEFETPRFRYLDTLGFSSTRLRRFLPFVSFCVDAAIIRSDLQLLQL